MSLGVVEVFSNSHLCGYVVIDVPSEGVDYGYLASNPARGKKRRLKAAKQRRTWVELDEIRSLLAAPASIGLCSRR